MRWWLWVLIIAGAILVVGLAWYAAMAWVIGRSRQR
jgi:hypothetical protein